MYINLISTLNKYNMSMYINLLLYYIGGTMFQYYVKIIPTLYQRKDNTVFYSNQFSVTKHNKVNSNLKK